MTAIDNNRIDLALVNLRRTLNTLKADERSNEVQSVQFQRLLKVTKDLRNLEKGKPYRDQKLVEKEWNEYLNGSASTLSNRNKRALSWIPPIATSSEFVDYLSKCGSRLSGRVIQGLVYSCHVVWGHSFCDSREFNVIRNSLSEYEGRSSILRIWRGDNIRMVLDAKAPEHLADHILSKAINLEETASEWSLGNNTAFFIACATCVWRKMLARMDGDLSVCKSLLTNVAMWPNWSLSDYKNLMSETISIGAWDKSSESRREFIRFVQSDKRLGDPRLPANQKNWLGMTASARARFTQWLSERDIIFFFEHVLPKGHDPQGRKDFWLRYVRQLKQSRPLLTSNDEFSLRRRFENFNSLAFSYGRVGATASGSAFLLDFGALLVVEFADVGAIYIYEADKVQRVVGDFWSERTFTICTSGVWTTKIGLKQRSICKYWLSHMPGWQHTVRNVLASHGIRGD